MKRELLVVALFSFVVNLLMLAPSLYMLQVFDRVLVSQNLLTLVSSTIILVFLLSVVAFSEWGRSRLLVRIGIRMDQGVNQRLFQSGFQAQLDQPQPNPSQPITDLTNIRQFLTGNGVFAFFDLPWLPIYIGVLYLLHPLLGYLGVIFGCVMGLVAWLSHRLSAKPMQNVQHSWTAVSNDQQGKFRNAESIEVLGMFGALQQSWWQRYMQQFLVQGKVDRLGRNMGALSKFLRHSKQSIALGAGAWLVIHGELTPGAMIASNVLMTRALQPIDMIVNAWKGFVTARTSHTRLQQLLENYAVEPEAGVDQPLNGDIELIDLTATAANREEPILYQLSLHVQPGTVMAVVGPSGSGKSTLVRSILGLWPHVQGRVQLDGTPVEAWDRIELGHQLGYLPQDVELMNGSIAQNIARFGEVDSEQVIQAAQLAGVHEMVLRFPHGYDMVVGESGGILSAGQRQRIALARALYGMPPIVVLDEPNANLDEAGEVALVQAIQQLKQQHRTVILVTHRKSIISVTDQLLTLENGKIHSIQQRPVLHKEK
jgi:ATP-binding cassette subfamily C exporter for protease/lipase